MANPNKRKGDQFERDVVKYLLANGFPAARNALTGQKYDKGDILGIAGWTFQAKNYKHISAGVREAVDGAEQQSSHIGPQQMFAGIVKRPGKSVEHSYVAMPLWKFVEMMKKRQSW